MSKIIILQPVVPIYRRGLFDRMALHFGSSFIVYASNQNMGVLTLGAANSSWYRQLGPIRSLLFGLEWQAGSLSIPVQRGDIAVISGNPRNLANLAVLLKARAKGARVIWWGQYWSASSVEWRAAIRIGLMRLAHVNLLYTDKEVAAYQRSHLGLRGSQTFALNNGIETGKIRTLRKVYKAAERQDRVLFIGRITAKASIITLLLALGEAACHHIALDIIGDGGEEELQARKFAGSAGLDKRVAWHGGTADERQIAAVANQCKAFVYPGSVGLSLIHGLAYGLPAIVHDDPITHMPEIAAFKANENGRTFERGNSASLSAALANLLADSKSLDDMSKAAICTVQTSFNLEDMFMRFCSAINAARRI